MKTITTSEILDKIKNKEVIYISAESVSYEYTELYDKEFPEKLKQLKNEIIEVGLFYSKTKETLYETYKFL